MFRPPFLNPPPPPALYAPWLAAYPYGHPESDDFLHNPDPNRDHRNDRGGTIFTKRGLANLGCVILLVIGLVALFAGYPITSYFLKPIQSFRGGFNLGGINASDQVPTMSGNWDLFDLQTPRDAYSKPDYMNGKDWQLIFSDEFNVDGRTFYPGDDPYWEAVDLHYWATNNMEWYDPAAVITKNGFCGSPCRAGCGASLEGMWPYTYDSCDVGTVKNQTRDGLPVAATINGDPSANDELSYLPGQRLCRCTCPGEDHPGPVHYDGTYVGRSAPEIDVFEAQVTGEPLAGEVSISMSCQWARTWFNTTDTLIIPDPEVAHLNSYAGGAFQQATSVVVHTNQENYEGNGNVWSIYGFQYKPGFDGASSGTELIPRHGKIAWTLRQEGMAADTPLLSTNSRALADGAGDDDSDLYESTVDLAVGNRFSPRS
ncbi:glycoside hydrolase family 16 protein [Cristinia sonorae]|uniref:Glycoside hydrolase family 16 protein n=1 Tax=Cristinia sonorae TaxID=1940300 RepID=A0A8K0XNN1_9AGAR|nr:glycoside hydrolase family 16 protein [Cristinia sonorae]